MHIHVLQHVPFEGPAAIASWAQRNSVALTVTHMYKGEMLPVDHTYSLLVVMGGPMGVGEEKQYPWIKQEKWFIQEAVSAGKYVVGICLGAQMIASVMGASVRKHVHKEIGWFPVYTIESENEKLLSLPARMPVFHWHGDTFEIPSGAKHIARSRACENQCFIYENRVIGMQFHLESTPESISALVSNCSDELTGGPYVQHQREILSAAPDYCKQTNVVLHDLLYRFSMLSR